MDNELKIKLFFIVVLPIILVLFRFSKVTKKSFFGSLYGLVTAFIFLSFSVGLVIFIGYFFDKYEIKDLEDIVGIIFTFLLLISIPIYYFRKKITSIFYDDKGKAKTILTPDTYESLNESEKQFYDSFRGKF